MLGNLVRGGRPPGRVRGQISFETVRVRVVAVQHGHQVTDVGRGQPKRFDLGQFRVGRHVGYTVPEIGERVVDALRAPPFLFVGRVPALDHAHYWYRQKGRGRSVRRATRDLLLLLLLTFVTLDDRVVVLLLMVLLRKITHWLCNRSKRLIVYDETNDFEYMEEK